MERKNVLYAEDNSAIREMVLIWLKENLLEQINLEIFEEGISLEKRLQQGPKGIDLVLTDNNMPYIDGSKLIKRYSKRPGFEKISFILYYGGFSDIGEQALSDGAFAYLIKGERNASDILISTIKSALKLE